MKKLILTITAITFIITSINAQTDTRERILFGLKAGLNYSNVYDTQGEGFRADPKAGLAAGAFLSIPIGKYLGLQPEVLFSQKGYKSTGTLLGTTYTHTRTTSFIDIPLFVSLKPSEFITLLAGPQFSYLMNQKDVFSNGSISYEQEKEFENNNVRKNTMGFIAGVDITLSHVVLGARAGWDIQRNNGDGTSTNPNYKNVWYQATLGYRFFN
ncbi:MAG: PorT family protein [Bacteroidota bacterium]|nr:PorT family protein [Bacteroidota bacterium]